MHVRASARATFHRSWKWEKVGVRKVVGEGGGAGVEEEEEDEGEKVEVEGKEGKVEVEEKVHANEENEWGGDDLRPLPFGPTNSIVRTTTSIGSEQSIGGGRKGEEGKQ